MTEHLLGKGINASVTAVSLAPTYNRIHFPIPELAPKVSILIPTRDRADLLETCIDGVLHRTNYSKFEILVADNGSVEEATSRLFRKLEREPSVRVLALPGPFNYSRLNNQAVLEASGEIILLLNNDVDVIAPGWLSEMVSHAIRPEVGAVGAKLCIGITLFSTRVSFLGWAGLAVSPAILVWVRRGMKLGCLVAWRFCEASQPLPGPALRYGGNFLVPLADLMRQI